MRIGQGSPGRVAAQQARAARAGRGCRTLKDKRNIVPALRTKGHMSTEEAPPGARRADARRNAVALLEAAKAVFAVSGVDAPAKEITDRAGVGVGPLYRHFPQRSDLIAAVLQHEIDACAAAGPALSAALPPGAALVSWLGRLTEFVGTKRGLAGALHSGDPAYDALPGYF